MDSLTRALNTAWDVEYYDRVKKREPKLNFTDWVKRDCGFEFSRFNGNQCARVTVMHDEKKYLIFMLKWSK